MQGLGSLRWNWRLTTLIAVAATCIYFGAAYWADISYVPDPDAPHNGIRVRLRQPDYVPLGGFAVSVRDIAGIFEDLGDTEAAPSRSAIELWENGTRLGPAHSSINEIASLGKGRFLHERGNGSGRITWSSSDNTNPVTNGRTYWLVNPSR